jgi:O-antigen/teichoic acid export membrane protein
VLSHHRQWLAGILVRAATGPVDYLLAMNGHRRATVVILALSAGLNIALNFTLIPLLGMLGAALATTLAIAFSVTTAAIMAWMRLGARAFFL